MAGRGGNSSDSKPSKARAGSGAASSRTRAPSRPAMTQAQFLEETRKQAQGRGLNFDPPKPGRSTALVPTQTGGSGPPSIPGSRGVMAPGSSGGSGANVPANRTSLTTTPNTRQIPLNFSSATQDTVRAALGKALGGALRVGSRGIPLVGQIAGSTAANANEAELLEFYLRQNQANAATTPTAPIEAEPELPPTVVTASRPRSAPKPAKGKSRSAADNSADELNAKELARIQRVNKGEEADRPPQGLAKGGIVKKPGKPMKAISAGKPEAKPEMKKPNFSAISKGGFAKAKKSK